MDYAGPPAAARGHDQHIVGSASVLEGASSCEWACRADMPRWRSSEGGCRPGLLLHNHADHFLLFSIRSGANRGHAAADVGVSGYSDTVGEKLRATLSPPAREVL